MDIPTLLKWHYMIFLIPCGIAALLLLISSLRLGHHGGYHGGYHGGHGVGGAHGHTGFHMPHGTQSGSAAPGPQAPAHMGSMAGHGGHGAQATAHAPAHTGGPSGQAHDAPAHTGSASGEAGHAPAHTGSASGHGHTAGHAQNAHPTVRARLGKVEVARTGEPRRDLAITTNFIIHFVGADRAPLVMLMEAFCLMWGVCGYWANQLTLHVANPSLKQILPSLGIALGGGVIGARVAAEILARVLPPDESLDVSRNRLFGLTGSIAFPVSATSGRIHIYDTFGTLHDEMCRVEPGHPDIAKGCKALVMDMDAQGHLLVEEVPDSVP